MGKKKKKKKKNKRKGQILAASQSYSQDNRPMAAPTSPNVNNPAPHAASTNITSSPNSVAPTASNSNVVTHVNTDLRFFFIVTVVMAVILAGIYILDQQTNFILNTGQWLWDWLGLS